jgi:UDP-N-acetylmuramoyl-tripeptide--D-alanyl-D-alanine ligase
MTLEIQKVASAMEAAGAAPAGSASGWSVDTRTQNSGDVYFALRGPNHDGHDYVAAAHEKGASAMVVERSSGLRGELVVHDTLCALQTLGAWARAQWGGTLIGVTGSAGKTTTKDAIAHVLAAELRVGKTVGNFNNHVGVPLSILRLPDDCTTAVLEMGMNHAGEICRLAEIARPQIGVVTNVGYAHVEFFSGIEGVAAAKRELIEGLPPDGIAVLNADDPHVREFGAVHPGKSVTFGFSESATVRAEAAQFGPEGSRFRTCGVDFETGMAGRHAVMNLLAAIAVARVFEIPAGRLRDAVRSFGAGKMRGERSTHNGITVWNDCYNSNPEAARSMIDVLRDTPAHTRIAVLGEMLELGHASVELHRELGRYAAQHGVDVLIGVHGSGREMVDAARAEGLRSEYFDEPVAAGEYARSIAREGDAVLFKGSRGVRVERALERFVA